jgi:basic membrane protein A
MDRSGGKSRATLAVAAAATLALGIAACGSSNKSSTSSGGGASTGASTQSSGGSAGTEIKVGAALIGPKNDKSFNQAAYMGILAAQKDHPELKLTSVLENKETDQARTDALETLGPITNLIMAVSASFGPVLDVEAPKFPKDYFINVAGYTKQFHENVTGLANDWGAPAYVAGVIAANMTKTGTVGYVGGAEIPPTVHGSNGFKAGALSVNPKIKVLNNIVGDFNDVSKAKAATAAMIADGADVIFPFLDAGIAGSYAAGKASGKNPAMFKLTIPDCEAYPNMVGTEVVNNVAMVQRLMDSYVNKTLKPGAIFLDLQEPDLQTLKLCPKYAADKKIAKVTQDTIDAVNSGKIKLPANAINARPSYPHTEGFGK